jgi:hypothetical protein
LKGANTFALIGSGKVLKELNILERLKFITHECFSTKTPEQTYAIVRKELTAFLDLKDDVTPQHFNDLADDLLKIVNEKASLATELGKVETDLKRHTPRGR